MNVLLVQFENWQTALEDFQKNIEKELEEIRRHKAEVRQMKIDLIDHLGQGRYVRDENRIIISAPEIIIGDTDKSGMLQNGSSRVIIRANNINLEGVGSGATDTGSIISRAASIRQIAVDPGIDGTESVVKPTSEIVSQARSLTLKSDDAEGFFSSDAPSAGTGIHLSSNSMVSIDATKSCETQSEQLENLEKGLKTIVSDLKEDMKNVKSATASLMSKMKTLVSKDIMNLDAITTRTNYLDIEELHTEFSQLSSSLYNTMTDYFNVLSRLAEANRQLDCVKEQKEEINKMKSSFKEKTTDTFITLQSENINLTSIDGEGNLRTNDGAGINLEGKEISLSSYDNDGALIKESGIFMGSQEVEINTANPKISDKNIDLSAEGSVRVISKAIEVEAVDYETKDNKTEEKSLTKEGSFTVRAEKINLNATDTEGKATGSIAANAKAVEVKAMDVDKEKRTDKSLAAGSTLLLLAEKVYAGSKDKKTKSKSVQVASDKVGLFGDTTVELQQDGKAILQLSGGDASLSGSKTTFYGETTLQGKVTFKSDVTAGTVDMKNLKVQTSFKTPYTTEGIAVPGAPSTAKLGAKLSEEELKSNTK